MTRAELAAIESKFSTVICAPACSSYEGLSTQVAVGIAEGLKHDSSVHCDELVSIAKPLLTDFVGSAMPEESLRQGRDDLP